MGFWNNVLRSAVGAVLFPRETIYNLWDPEGLGTALRESISDLSPAQMYRSQPHLRTVTSFLGRNVGQLGIHVFEVVDENDRKRRRDSRAAKVLGRPNPTMTAYQLKYALTVDKALYDWAFLLPVTGPDGSDQLWRVPPAWVTPSPNGPFSAPSYKIYQQEKGKLPPGFGNSEGFIELREDQLIVFKGYDPTSTYKGSAPIDALKEVLQEQVESSVYRKQVWKRGGRVSSVLERPKDAPAWTDAQANLFREDWYSNWTGRGPKAGGTPILEDGMTLKKVDFSAKDQEWAEGIKLALAAVAGAYHISPAMVGSMESATYNNVKEYRKMLFGDSLGPLLVDLQDTLNQYLLPRYGEQDLYAEFNIWAKLAGSFEEQASFLQAAVGAPYMVRNEARARLNLPAIEGGDELITPLNVLVGSMANPQDSAPDPAEPPTPGELEEADKGRPPVEIKATLADRDYVLKYRQTLEAFFKRQGRVVQSRLGAKADWWDQTRWFHELQDELLKLHITITQDAAIEALKAAGIDPTEYDPARTVAFLTERAKRDSEAINKSTYGKIQQALKDDDDIDVLFVALVASAAVLAQSMATSSLSWGKLESGRQTGAGSKTWIVTSKNPRSSHSSINGQTVPLESKFSNGLHWPGDPGGSVDEVAGCTCQVNVVY